MAFDFVPTLVRELDLPEPGIRAVMQLFGDGATVPFIARYRKEAKGGLDEVQIRAIQDRATYLLELEQRRQAILEEIEKQGKLTDELRRELERCTVKADL